MISISMGGVGFLSFFLFLLVGWSRLVASDEGMIDQGGAADRLLEHLYDRAILKYEKDPNRRLLSSDNPLDEICRVVQDSFNKTVDCRCLGSLHSSFSMSCEYDQEICSSASSSMSCGQPQIAVSMVEGKIFSSTTCVKNYRRGMLPMEDTCVFVDACPNAALDGFCGCTASYGGHVCGSCEICPGGRAISVDCSNLNVEAVTKTCQPVDLDLNLSGGSGSLAGFAPSFSGFCTELEQQLNNKIACDCSDAVGGSFAITCQTTEEVCMNDETHCGQVKSTVDVVDGKMDTVTSCGKYTSEPFMGGETCTGIQLCTDGNSVCGCWATYDGEQCNSCKMCEGGKGLTLDCSNVHNDAIVEQCQPLNLTKSYEFLPNYPVGSEEQISRPSSGTPIIRLTLVVVTTFFGAINRL